MKKTMDGDRMDVKEFLRKSIRENQEEARQYLLEERKRQFTKLSLNNGLPPLFKNKTLRNFDSGENFPAFNQACDFVDRFPNTKGLLLSGDIGVGKTHLAAGITNALNKRLYSTYFGNIVDIIFFFRTSYRKDALISEEGLIDLICNRVDLLVIDDLGKENNTDHTLSLLYQIINKLYENSRPIIITTNFNAVSLSQKLGERGESIVSRLSAMCKPVKLTGRDRRLG